MKLTLEIGKLDCNGRNNNGRIADNIAKHVSAGPQLPLELCRAAEGRKERKLEIWKEFNQKMVSN